MTRQDIINEGARILKEIDQIFLDAEHWNRAVRKPRQVPIDPDPDGSLGALRMALKTMLKTEADRGNFPAPLTP